jgi:rare lipoprotein A
MLCRGDSSLAGIFSRWGRRFLAGIAISGLTLTAAQADPRIDEETGPALTSATAPLGAQDRLCSAAHLQQRGVASWYGRHWRGRKTASGQRYDERLLTAASRSLPLATRARVTNLQNGRWVNVLVNDRGPYVGGRIMDLSARAAALLGMTQSGLAPVAITALPDHSSI